MGEGMTEAEVRELVQGTVNVGLWFVVIAVLAIYLATPATDGGPRRWHIWEARVKAFLASRRRYVEPHDDEEASSAARTGAEADEADAPHQDAGAVAVRGAVRGADAGDPAQTIAFTAEELRAISLMVAHKIANPDAKKTDTIMVGWPEIKGRSGDKNSKYARASEVYEHVFKPPVKVAPITGRTLPPGQSYVGERPAPAETA